MEHLKCPGFRFRPTDEELVGFYLARKAGGLFLPPGVIDDVGMQTFEPWDLLGLSHQTEDEEEWYFFCRRMQKWVGGARANRATRTGFWKATGRDREVRAAKGRGGGSASPVLGMRKSLVFYKGRAPRGERTPWIVHEYRLGGQGEEEVCPWVLCKMFRKVDSQVVMEKRKGVEDSSPVSGGESGVKGQVDQRARDWGPDFCFDGDTCADLLDLCDPVLPGREWEVVESMNTHVQSLQAPACLSEGSLEEALASEPSICIEDLLLPSRSLDVAEGQWPLPEVCIGDDGEPCEQVLDLTLGDDGCHGIMNEAGEGYLDTFGWDVLLDNV